jgi:hypothetical protein
MALSEQQLERVLTRIASGESQASIARSLEIDAGNLTRELQRDDDVIQRSARARLDSAEAWLDKGLAVIESALDKRGTVDATAARAYAQECARRAAVRNPAYRDKVDTNITARVTTSAESLSTEELMQIAAGKTRGGT